MVTRLSFLRPERRQFPITWANFLQVVGTSQGIYWQNDLKADFLGDETNQFYIVKWPRQQNHVMLALKST